MLVESSSADRQGVPIKTPRSTSKQQQQPQHSKSQTKVNQFFAPVDGSSRDSDTPSGYQQHREQQPLQQYREPLQPLHLQQASPIEGLIDYRSPSLTPLSWPVAGTATVTPPKAADTPAAAQAKSSGKYSSCAAGSGSSDVASPGRSVLAMQQQLAAVEQKHQQELEQLQSGARCVTHFLNYLCTQPQLVATICRGVLCLWLCHAALTFWCCALDFGA